MKPARAGYRHVEAVEKVPSRNLRVGLTKRDLIGCPTIDAKVFGGVNGCRNSAKNCRCQNDQSFSTASLDVTNTMSKNRRPFFQLSFISSEAGIAVPSASEVLARVRSVAPWDEASICPARSEFPRVHISWHDSEGFNVHCFENEQSLGQFLVNGREFSPPGIEINLGGQVLERWPRELFVSEALAAEALEYFFDYAEPKPSLCWTGTGDFPRETIWEGREERQAWERTHRTQ